MIDMTQFDILGAYWEYSFVNWSDKSFEFTMVYNVTCIGFDRRRSDIWHFCVGYLIDIDPRIFAIWDTNMKLIVCHGQKVNIAWTVAVYWCACQDFGIKWDKND